MINENTNDVSFFYPLAIILKELNMHSSYIAGADAETLKKLEVGSEHQDMIMSILKQIMPIVYAIFIDASVSVKNGLIVNHDGVTLKIDRIKDNPVFTAGRNRLIDIDGLLMAWIIKRVLAEWLMLVIKNNDLYTALMKDETSIMLTLTENVQNLSVPYEEKSYSISVIS